MLKVTVVVPVHNAGDYLHRCAPSLLRQTIGRDAYEIVYVDDGSTDGSGARLDRLAAQHPQHVRVVHQENSGWPGKPRNVGVRHARGEYVQFVDQDDELLPGALENLYALAVRNDSDIVLGRVVGTMAGPSRVFKRTVDRCTVADAPLFESLTPHKMFRRAFLLDHGIEFPEGRVRLEDQLFMARAYVRAKTVSILSTPCYVWNRREDGGNTSATATTPETYYAHLRQVIDAVKEGTDPGPLQDDLLRRSYRVELLRPVSEPRVLQRSGAALDRYFTTVRRTALDCFPTGVREGLPAISRLRATLLEEGRLDSLVELARRVRAIRPRLTVEDIHWRGGGLHITTTIDMLRPDGEPLMLHERKGRLCLDPELLNGIKGAENWTVPDPLAHAEGELLTHDTTRDEWWFPDADLAPRTEPAGGGRHRVLLSGTTRIDPLTLAGGEPLLPGTHLVWASAQLLGVGRRARVIPDGSLARIRTAAAGSPPRLIIPTRTPHEGQLRLAVGPPGATALHHRLLLRTTTSPDLRRTTRNLLHRLPPALRRRAGRLARRADPWSAR
ncbi:glycosyl transferase [Streptomyces davaonensis JCM 4913]|uniref:Glycosyl transferase n=1 Tax=Streptomyces davaonensis (strain DSM 101723 / JCM 4913 / KCC S-0913 / 768) TaxID=1214101 RepID=K4R0H0_STRDJ|nr:glycosyltransferase family A protein [Streptomyces davaonensis]CCK29781.1 glycosyl transferase [Streptomyces davaonensis JCM 4913]